MPQTLTPSSSLHGLAHCDKMPEPCAESSIELEIRNIPLGNKTASSTSEFSHLPSPISVSSKTSCSTPRRVCSFQEFPNDRTLLHQAFEGGENLKLKFYPASKASPKPRVLNAEILKSFQPFTMSVVLLVRIYCPALEIEGDFVLKLLDRRFMFGARRLQDMIEWSPQVEKSYRKFVLSDQHASHYNYVKRLMNEDRWGLLEEAEEWDVARQETCIHALCHDLYESELETYHRLERLQGFDIPRLFGCVELLESDAWQDIGLIENTHHLTSSPSFVPGLLLQYIPNAFSLEDIVVANPPPPAPRQSWQYIIDDAIRIVMLIRSHEIINSDDKCRNSLVRWDAATDKYKVFMMDFGQCRFRQPSDSEDDWMGEQSFTNDEDAVGMTMQMQLDKYRGGGYEWHESEYSKKLKEIDQIRMQNLDAPLLDSACS